MPPGVAFESPGLRALKEINSWGCRGIACVGIAKTSHFIHFLFALILSALFFIVFLHIILVYLLCSIPWQFFVSKKGLWGLKTNTHGMNKLRLWDCIFLSVPGHT